MFRLSLLLLLLLLLLSAAEFGCCCCTKSRSSSIGPSRKSSPRSSSGSVCSPDVLRSCWSGENSRVSSSMGCRLGSGGRPCSSRDRRGGFPTAADGDVGGATVGRMGGPAGTSSPSWRLSSCSSISSIPEIVRTERGRSLEGSPFCAVRASCNGRCCWCCCCCRCCCLWFCGCFCCCCAGVCR